jgi:hypothetical protein
LFGIIKSIDGNPFSHEKHKSEYDKLCTFVLDYVQNEMKQTYCLQEVRIPEDKYLDPDYHHLPRCPIFMSTEFLNDPQQNAGRRALVLI